MKQNCSFLVIRVWEAFLSLPFHFNLNAVQAAEKMATKWLTVTYKSFIRTHSMFEKYNVSAMLEECAAGGGGEYEVQVRLLLLLF